MTRPGLSPAHVACALARRICLHTPHHARRMLVCATQSQYIYVGETDTTFSTPIPSFCVIRSRASAAAAAPPSRVSSAHFQMEYPISEANATCAGKASGGWDLHVWRGGIYGVGVSGI